MTVVLLVLATLTAIVQPAYHELVFPMSNQKLRIAVLGAGRIGKVHTANLTSRISGAEVAAIADVSAELAGPVAKQFGVQEVATGHRELLQRRDIDAVAICTPTGTHFDIIQEATAAGKHIFCEKPIDLSLERIRRLNDHVAASGVQLMVGFNRRFDPNFQRIREAVESGKIGTPEVLRITSRDPAPPPEAYLRASGGIFLDMTIHDFDMSRFLMGSDVVEVFAMADVFTDPMVRKVGGWDTAVVTLKFANGAFGTIDNSRRAVYGYDQRAEIFGSGGMASIANNTPDNAVLFDASGGHSSRLLHFFMDRYTESYAREMQAFVDAVRDQKPVPVGGADGEAAVAIGLAAAKSVREGRPVRVEEV